MKWSSLHKLIGFILAANYFAFQVELFEDEYEANHPPMSFTCSISRTTITWESFDKENAQQAFVFDANIRLCLLVVLSSQSATPDSPVTRYQPIRDKSPPAG